MNRLVRDQSGSTLPLFAVILAVGTLLLGGVLNAGLVFLEDRRMQALADMIALLSVRDSDHSAGFARSVIADQGRDPALYDPVLIPGHYTPDPALAPEARFSAGERPFNAVRVLLHAATEEGEGGMLLARASAAREDRISFAVGSRLLRVEDGISGRLLEGLLGLDAAITAADYEALAAIRIDASTFLEALEAADGTRVGGHDRLADTTFASYSVLEAIRMSAPAGERSLIERLVRDVRLASRRVSFGDIAAIDPALPNALASGESGAKLSVLDLVTATALAATGERQIDIDAGTRLSRLRLLVGERPQTPPVDGSAGPGSRAETRQLALDVETGPGHRSLDLRVEAARAEAEVVRVTCSPQRRVEAEFVVETSPARLVINGGGPLARPVVVDLGSRERHVVQMDQRHFESGAPVRVTGGAGFGSSLPALGPVMGPLVRHAGEWLEEAGLNVAEADLFLRDASCGHPFLVE